MSTASVFVCGSRPRILRAAGLIRFAGIVLPMKGVRHCCPLTVVVESGSKIWPETTFPPVQALLAPATAPPRFPEKSPVRNAEFAKTPTGRIQLFNKAMGDLSEHLGPELIKMLADMADGWREALPAIEPAIIGTM